MTGVPPVAFETTRDDPVAVFSAKASEVDDAEDDRTGPFYSDTVVGSENRAKEADPCGEPNEVPAA
jgi:hypothetical protein